MGMMDMMKMMKQAGQIKADMEALQKRLGETPYTGVSADGSVHVVVLGGFVESIKIHSTSSPHLEQSVIEAVNEALGQGKREGQEEMAKLTGGINIPGLF